MKMNYKVSLLLIFVCFTIVTELEAARSCKDDCDCRITKGEKCVFKRRNRIRHCSLSKNKSMCLCKRGCLNTAGILIGQSRKSARTCLKPKVQTQYAGRYYSRCKCINPNNNTMCCKKIRRRRKS